ncbi:MAG: cell division protein ZipA [Halieaceae bacterium]|jgi:cell division protein ZipA
MDLTIRDWMVIAGVLLIFAVLVDAWRRVRKERRSTVKLDLAKPYETDDPRAAQLAWLKELPNGGARVVERGDLLAAAAKSKEEAVATSDDAQVSSPLDDSDEETLSQHPEQSTAANNHQENDLEEALFVGMSSTAEPENLDWLDDMPAEARVAASKETEIQAGRLPRDIDPEVFMLNVVARSPDGFSGDDILHILLACDLRFGDMSFFHRHEFEAGRGAIQFSVANMMQPGVFDIDDMAKFNTPGLVFFLTLPGPEDMMKAFDYMLETAQAVARNLDGDVLDESHSVVTKQTLEHCRQQIRDLERRMLAKIR